MAGQSAMMAQYHGVRTRYPGHLVLFRVGDFFESFGEDAELVARELDIVLTSRQADGTGKKIPMAGVPQHALENYLSRLVRKGHRVVICDQVEEAKEAKGIIERAVTRVVTPGTVVEESLLPRGQTNYLAAVAGSTTAGYAVVLVEVSTAEVLLRTYPAGPVLPVIHDIAVLSPSEVLLEEGTSAAAPETLSAWTASLPSARIVPLPPEGGRSELPTPWNDSAASSPEVGRALAMAAGYVERCAPTILGTLSPPVRYDQRSQMLLDVKTLRHLEVTEPMNPALRGSRTLLDVVNVAESPAGRRIVTSWLRSPLADVKAIDQRLDGVQWLSDLPGGLLKIRTRLRSLADLSRLSSRVLARRASPRDLRAIGETLVGARELRDLIESLSPPPPPVLREALQRIPRELPFAEHLLAAIPPEASGVPSSEGSLVPEAFPDLGRLREREAEILRKLSDLEKKEATATGIRNLKIGYTQVFGYYFEVTRPHLAKVPADRWRRKQTLSTAERFTSDELGELETSVLSVREEAGQVESHLWEKLLEEVTLETPRLRETGEAIGLVDALVAFAHGGKERGWVRPKVLPSGPIKIRQGRHPVLEAVLGPAFVPNDTDLGDTGARLLLLTGPNMAGKSTYMRQVGLIVLLAQCGSYVPAKYAEIGVVNYLATRMGFTDETGQGKSSFMVEMSEVAEILARADSGSLVLLDEVGRGTSTSDGLALAWAIIQHLHDRLKSRTIVATHYHQLADLVAPLASARNAHLGVMDREGEVTFLRTLLPGATNKSYGIHVAKLAGVPPSVTREAEKVLHQMEGRVNSHPGSEGNRKSPSGPRYTQALLVHDEGSERALRLQVELQKMDSLNLTPLEALNRLHKLIEEAKKGEGSPE